MFPQRRLSLRTLTFLILQPDLPPTSISSSLFFRSISINFAFIFTPLFVIIFLGPLFGLVAGFAGPIYLQVEMVTELCVPAVADSET